MLIDVETDVLVVREGEMWRGGGKIENSSKYEIQITLENYFVMEWKRWGLMALVSSNNNNMIR